MSTPEEILPGVYGVNLTIVNAFFITDDAVTIVDTGLKSGATKIEAAIKEVGRSLDDAKNIALTHHHNDHRGGLSQLRREGMRVFAHPLDAPIVRGERKAPGPNGIVRKILMAPLAPLMRVPDSVVDVEVTDGDQIPDTGGMCAIHTPGHTLGHVSFLHPDKRILFVGDAARHMGTLANTQANFAEDMDEAKRTIGRIAGLDFDTAVFGHGKVLRGKANAEFRKLADKLGGS